MHDTLLTSNEAAERLGLSRAGFYAWLAASDAGTFVLRGQDFTIEYFQSGAKGQGRIQIAESEIQRILEAMKVRPKRLVPRRRTRSTMHFPGITVPLGVPDDYE